MAWGNEGAFAFTPLVVRESLLGENLGMVNREREEYAKNLAAHAGNFVVDHKANPESLALAHRVLALALHLSPRNKQALVLNFQLGKGVMPRKRDSQYSAKSLAHLLLTRAEVLFQQKGEENSLLSKCFIDLAATFDPRNEDAVYAFQLQEINFGPVPWHRFTDQTPLRKSAQSSK